MRVSTAFLATLLSVASVTSAQSLYERDVSDDHPALVARAAYADAYHELLEAREAYDDAYDGFLAARDEHALAARGNAPSITLPGGKAKGQKYLCPICQKTKVSQEQLNGKVHAECTKKPKGHWSPLKGGPPV